MQDKVFALIYKSISCVEQKMNKFDLQELKQRLWISYSITGVDYDRKVNFYPEWFELRRSIVQNVFQDKKFNLLMMELLVFFPGDHNDIERTSAEKEQDISFLKYSVANLYLRYKELADKYEIDLTDYVKYVCNLVYSEFYYHNFRAPLIGVELEAEPLKIGDFEIRKLKEKEILTLLSSIDNSKYSYVSKIEEIINGPFPRLQTACWIFYTKQQVRNSTPKSLRWLFTKSFGYQSDDIVDNNIKTLITAFRLYDNSGVGIRSVFERRTHAIEYVELEPSWERLFLSGEFGYRMDLKRLVITKEKACEIESIYYMLIKIEGMGLIPLNRAIGHFFQAYQHNFYIYKFADLIISFEALFNEKKVSEISRIKKIYLIVKNNRIPLYSIYPAVKRAKYLLEQTKKKRTQIQNILIGQKNSGIYPFRNKTLHGTIDVDQSELKKYTIDLEEIVSKSLKRLINIVLEEPLSWNTQNYFTKLDQYLKIE